MDDSKQCYSKCPVEQTLDLISKKWVSKIIWYLDKGTKRFNELERLIPGIPRKVLVQQLKELELYGVVKRIVYAQVPPKVEYSLTPMGGELAPIFESIAGWGYKYGKDLGCLEDAQASEGKDIPVLNGIKG
jgi:DNA-binding HxlR family transcriptional regulator